MKMKITKHTISSINNQYTVRTRCPGKKCVVGIEDYVNIKE